MLVRFVSLAVLAMIAAHPAHAGWKKANAAYKRGDFATVLENLVPLAEGGDANAQYNVGVMYAQGNGVGRDDFLAMHWFRKAALQERVGAQLNLGIVYSRGGAVPQNDAEAAVWFGKAAAAGHPAAQFNFGVMHETGKGVPQDESEAAIWYRKAVERGFADAQVSLGTLYGTGQGVDQDQVEALTWLEIGAAQGSKVAAQKRDVLVMTMTDEQISLAKSRVRGWVPCGRPPQKRSCP
mgnify:FL=1